MWRKSGLCYIGLGVFILLVTHITMIQRNFGTLDDGESDGPSGNLVIFQTKRNTRESAYGLNLRQHADYPGPNPRNVFENKLRKLLEIMEYNLDSSAYSVEHAPSERSELGIQGYFPDEFLSCDDIDNITSRTYLASGWTKAVYSGYYRGSPVAMKTVDIHGQDVKTCREAGGSSTGCYVKAAKKIIKELVVLQAMANENVLKVLGFCLPRNADDNLWVAMVTELGESVDLIKLLQMSWEDRLRVCLDMTKIIHWMSSNPYGSMSMNDFRRQQFVLVSGVLKLSDVDDTWFEDPVCASNIDCTVTFSSSNFTQVTSCTHRRCVEYNEKRNIFNAGRHFVTFLLPHGAPARLRPFISDVVSAYSDLTLTCKQLLDLMIKVTELYKSGWYMNRTTEQTPAYTRLNDIDLPGLHDYQCRYSLSVNDCTITVFDEREGEQLCDRDEQCRGFVMSPLRTWTGRAVVHLKNAVEGSKPSPGMTLYLKPG